jgi:hypothetical protein
MISFSLRQALLPKWKDLVPIYINGLVGYRLLLDITDMREIKLNLATQNPD